MGTFSDWHAALCWAWLALTAAVLWPDIGRRDAVGRTAGRRRRHVLQENGTQLYIADALSGTDIAYRREGAWTWATTDVTTGARTVNQFLIRQYLDEVSRIFHVP